MRGNIFKIKEGKTNQWKDWCKSLATIYKEEAIATLKEEHCVQEAFFFFTINNQDYTMSMIEGNVLPSTERELNVKHKLNVKECLERVTSVTTLYHLKQNN